VPIMRENIVESDRPQIAIWGMRISHRVPFSAYTYSEYVIEVKFTLEQATKSQKGSKV
jgi:hypothetical protein